MHYVPELTHGNATCRNNSTYGLGAVSRIVFSKEVESGTATLMKCY
jgi:hypothetical protein